jgi:hypothetical protein
MTNAETNIESFGSGTLKKLPSRINTPFPLCIDESRNANPMVSGSESAAETEKPTIGR